ncbi:MAG: hypothetical protein JWR26_1905 [Pedosphaera sp.]|nr:hypothetical protein [Pedosphaera sp.]
MAKLRTSPPASLWTQGYLSGCVADCKKKLAYGQNPEDAYENLKLRLSPEEMEPIIKEEFKKIAQRELRDHINDLG